MTRMNKFKNNNLFKKTATVSGGMSHSKSKTGLGTANSTKTTLNQNGLF